MAPGTGRGGHRGGRGGSAASRNNNSSTSTSTSGSGGAATENNNGTGAPITIIYKNTSSTSTIHQRQSSPYARHLRGSGKSIKSAINSILYDKDNQDNHLGNGNSPATRINGISKDLPDNNFYLHKKFKKPTVTAEPEIPNHKDDESTDILNNNKLGASVPTTTVYKPKFRSFAFTEPLQEDEIQERQPSPVPVRQPSTTNLTNQQILPSPCPVIPEEKVPQSMTPLPLLPLSSLTRKLSESSSSPGRTSLKRLDIQSLDDRISQIIDQNQSILATWPEHLTKKPKGNGGHGSGRASFSSSTTTSTTKNGYHHHPLTIGTSINGTPIVFERSSPSRGRSIGGYELQSSPSASASASSSPGACSSELSRLVSNNSNKSHLVRSNSDASSYLSLRLNDQATSTGTSTVTIDTPEAPDNSSFMIPKKKRRLSPLPGILSGGEVSEAGGTGAAEINTSRQGRSFSFSSLTHPQIHPPQEVDMTVRVSNCGNSGANVTIRQSQNQRIHSRINPEDLSTMSLLNDLDKNPPIRIRKTSIFEMDSSNSSSATSSPAPLAQFIPAKITATTNTSPTKRRGRPPRKSKEELLSSDSNSSNSLTTIAAPKVNPKLMPPLVPTVNPPHPEPQPQSKPQQILSEVVVQIKPEEIANNPNTSSNLLIHTSSLNPKRPTFLALKPMNTGPGTSGILAKSKKDTLGGILPSPETPRGAKNYNQMYINGHAYTYLGFKISTRSSYTCLFKPQPMFIPMETDPKLSMYSNWQPRPRDPKTPDFSISTNDSRINSRKSIEFSYTTSKGINLELTTTSPSLEKQSPIFSALGNIDGLLIPAVQGPGNGPISMSIPVPDLGPVNLLGAQTEPISPATPPPNFADDCCGGGGNGGSSSNSEYEIKPSIPIAFSGNKLIGIEHLSSSDIKMAQEKCNAAAAVAAAATTTTSSTSSESSSSSSPGSSPEERKPKLSSYSSNSTFPKGRSISLSIDSTTTNLLSNGHHPYSTLDEHDRPRSQSVSLSSPNSGSGPKVKIMEGGFESNEDYTYVRGRGRGRYVCEACGIRCKKPSMLRKHLKTHTDLRPYTCKLCNFSFKTKGNLTKHQKSKSHHKKCIGLGIHPDSSQSLEMTGPALSDDSDAEDDDDDDETDSNDEQGEDEDDRPIHPSRLEIPKQNPNPISTTTTTTRDPVDEKEIALSLLDLCQTTRIVPVVPQPQVPAETKSPAPGVPPKKDFEDAPIDLSVKPTAPVKLNGSMEIVAEAHRWEGEEEEFVRNGCLNLKKIRNNSGTGKEEKSAEVNTNVKTEPTSITPTERESKSPSQAQSLNNFEHEIKKRRRLSSSCSSIELPNCINPQPCSSNSNSSPPPVAIPGTTRPTQMKLHQPWLSPVASTSSSEVPEAGSGTTAPLLIATATSPVTSPASNAELDSPTANGNGSSSLVKDEVESNDSWTTNGPPPLEPSSKSPTKGFNGLLGLKPQAEFRQPSGAQAFVKDEGKAECNVCGKSFSRASQLTLHMNIHYLERPFRCDPCGVSFRTKGHLLKHRRSSSHDCKVYLTEAWGVANEENPRPFKCVDCKIAFRIHGHLAKHLRSKMHIMRMECLGKLPFGIYFEMEKSGLNLNEIDTTDCDMSLVSLQNLARKIYGESWREKLTLPIEEPAV